MRTLDWLVLVGTIGAIVIYGMWKGRRAGSSAQSYVLAGREMPWFTVAISVMATQASAITFLSTPGQGYADGLRFSQFYFGLPIAMVVLCATAVPIFQRLGVFTAYEYLEQRFDLKTRTLTSLLFLTQRGLGAGFGIYAPAAVLSVLMGWNIQVTTLVIGAAIILYTTSGGAEAVGRTQVQQFSVAIAGMAVAFLATVALLPDGVGVGDAALVAGAAGRMRAVTFDLDLKDRYNLWSGLLGGGFVALAYFGTDQSQVQRYLAGASIRESRLGLIFNGVMKIPMQVGILFLGTMVFAAHHFVLPPLYHNPVEAQLASQGPRGAEMRSLQDRHEMAFADRRRAALELVSAAERGDDAALSMAKSALGEAEARFDGIHNEAAALVRSSVPGSDGNDVNYVFLRFVLEHLPAGLVGLMLAVVFCSAMSASSAALNALATTTMVDVYHRLIAPQATDAQTVRAARVATVGWGLFSIACAQFANRLGTLIEAVNVMGSLFYGTILGIFLTAFYCRSVGATAVFIAAVVTEATVLAVHFSTDAFSYLWYNVIGAVMVVALGYLFQALLGGGKRAARSL
ncbi:MAG: sodium:solute symporter [Planctomycetes bacterium]|nr:sodium:solute symporter [Planctomycetota bacterium]